PASICRSRFNFRSAFSWDGIRTPPCPPPERPDLKDAPVSGDHHVEHAIGIRVLQRVVVCVDRQVDFREVLTVSLSLEDELPLLEPHANALARDAGHLRGEEDRRFRQDDVDEGIAGADLLALECGPRGLGTGFAGSRRESVDERLAEDAELPLERILEHAVDRPAPPVLPPHPRPASPASEAGRSGERFSPRRPSQSARRASGIAGRPRTPSVRSPGSPARIGACTWPRRVCSLQGRGRPPSTPGGRPGGVSRSPPRDLPGTLAPTTGR